MPTAALIRLGNITPTPAFGKSVEPFVLGSVVVESVEPFYVYQANTYMASIEPFSMLGGVSQVSVEPFDLEGKIKQVSIEVFSMMEASDGYFSPLNSPAVTVLVSAGAFTITVTDGTVVKPGDRVTLNGQTLTVASATSTTITFTVAIAVTANIGDVVELPGGDIAAPFYGWWTPISDVWPDLGPRDTD